MLKLVACTVGRTVVRPNFFGLMGYKNFNKLLLFRITMGLCCARFALL